MLNTFSSSALLPCRSTTAKFRLVCFELTRNGVLGLRLYNKFCHSQSGKIYEKPCGCSSAKMIADIRVQKPVAKICAALCCFKNSVAEFAIALCCSKNSVVEFAVALCGLKIGCGCTIMVRKLSCEIFAALHCFFREPSSAK